ncbi:glycosyltransferase involved in cell wall biosynthesis [Rathayibacter sp. PhB93]|uniref:glycosyltransferase n=1 Tax=unclassified Rathayibacter TaxID=2609250 RepID=UPI000F480343|nr:MULTISPECIES: glycosyltransferase [unclassified Rathayibacter]ROQ06263.1 glycosyltransferase involved in cell wall biosynthesis [Rathayibacter sp. PhB93]TDQ14020.1 glycosyltransferase involved in cell wall biosynthesis [Rathayibacter sp. PhB1]
MRIAFASHTAEVGVFKVGSHHLAREFAKAGHEVLHVSSPASFLHLARVRDRTVRERLRLALTSPRLDEYGVTHVEPFVVVPPGRLSPALRAFELRHPLRPWSRTLREWGRKPVDVLFIDQPLLGTAMIDVLTPRKVVYRPTDAHYDTVLRQAELSVLEAADAVVATSRPVLDDVLSESSRSLPELVIENGVEYDRFHESDRGNRSRSGVVYLGALDRRFDWATLAGLAASHPETPFEIAGPVAVQPSMQLPPNVRLRGGVPYSAAPDLLRSCSVGLLPFSDDPGNQGRSPMKYYEYLAAGLFVVASTSPALATRSAPGVWLYSNLPEAKAALGGALAVAGRSNEDGAAYAAQYSWASRAAALAHFVRGLE